MTCHELEALRLGLMNVLGTTDRSAREHAEKELDGHLEGPIGALAEADTLDGVQRHLDAALVELEEEVAAAGGEPSDARRASSDESDGESTDRYDYLRGRLVAVRDAERAVRRLTNQGESVLDGLDDAHHLLHEAFPVDDDD